jgi:hypothetical protein
MSFKNMASIAVLVVAVAFAIQLVGQNGVEAHQTSGQAGTSSQSSNLQFEYARLQLSDDGEKVTWLVAGNDRVRTESLKAAYQRLGGKGRTTFANMLDQIGSQGWSLVQVEGGVWIFTRQAS